MAAPIRAVFESEEPPKHPKSRLHEEAMSKALRRLTTVSSRRRVSTGQLEFTVEVAIDGTVSGQGRGRRKAHAEREAARQALKAMGLEA